MLQPLRLKDPQSMLDISDKSCRQPLHEVVGVVFTRSSELCVQYIRSQGPGERERVK